MDQLIIAHPGIVLRPVVVAKAVQNPFILFQPLFKPVARARIVGELEGVFPEVEQRERVQRTVGGRSGFRAQRTVDLAAAQIVGLCLAVAPAHVQTEATVVVQVCKLAQIRGVLGVGKHPLRELDGPGIAVVGLLEIALVAQTGRQHACRL